MVRFPLFLFLFLFLFLSAFSQSRRVAEIIKVPETRVDYYEMTQAGGSVLYLPMEFGKSTFSYSQQNAINKLKNAGIAEVDLVYSDYPAGQDFVALNKKRLESLEKIVPFVFSEAGIEFRKVRQTIAKTKATAQGLQHGFFIYFRERPTKTSGAEEVKKLKDALTTTPGGTGDHLIDKRDSSSAEFWCGTQALLVDTTEDELIWHIPKDVKRTITRMSVKDYLKSGKVPTINAKDYEGWDTVYHIKYGGDCDEIRDYFLYQLVDSTVSTVFKRHNWNKAMVIADVTGSMYPYTGQLLKWLAVTLTDKQKRYFVFFNDGDNKEDAAKVIGKTGGIYTVYTNHYDEVEKTIETAMTNGGGGDAPENNVEALLQAESICADCDSIVMIADNWAPVKDISLLEASGKPIKVVLCGVLGTINKDYLNLVRKTKGSLHLIEEDIYNLSEVQEGGTIVIHGKKYKLVKGEFVNEERFSL
jgi:hypothetical protein